MASLVPVSILRTLLKKTEAELPNNDAYALLVLEGASNAVRSTAGHPEWTETGETPAPARAKDITAWLAYRVYTNPQNLQRRTSGPVSDTYFDNGLVGLELSESEKEELGGMAPKASGLWVQPLDDGATVPPKTYLFDDHAGIRDGSSILYGDGIDAGAFG